MSKPETNLINLGVSRDGMNRSYLHFNDKFFYGRKDPFLVERIGTFMIEIDRLEEALELPKGTLDHLKEENFKKEAKG